MSREKGLFIPDADRIMLINVPGGCHGPEEYARSLIHDRVTNHLLKTGVDFQTIFVPSTDIKHDEDTNKIFGIQLPPSRQLERLYDAVEEAMRMSRIPVDRYPLN